MLLNSHSDSGFSHFVLTSEERLYGARGLIGCPGFRLKAPSCILEAPGAPKAPSGDRDAPPGQSAEGAVRGRWKKTPPGSPGLSGCHHAPIVCPWAELACIFHKYCLFAAASLLTISRGWQPRVARVGARATPACFQRLASRACALCRGPVPWENMAVTSADPGEGCGPCGFCQWRGKARAWGCCVSRVGGELMSWVLTRSSGALRASRSLLWGLPWAQ